MNGQQTDVMIADLLVSPIGASLDTRQRYLFQQTLHSLVRLAKAEQMLEIKGNVQRLIGTLPSADELADDLSCHLEFPQSK